MNDTAHREAVQKEMLGRLAIRKEFTRDLFRVYLKAPGADLEKFFQNHSLRDTNSTSNLLLLRIIGETTPSGIPAGLLPLIRGLKLKYTVQDAMYLRELATLLAQLNREGIPVLLLQGGAMRAFYHPNVIRDIGALKLLAPEENMPQIRSELLAQGYTLKFSSGDHYFQLIKEMVTVEFFSRRFADEPDSGSFARLKEEMIPFRWNGYEVFILNPEAMLVDLLASTFHYVADPKNIVTDERRVKWLLDAHYLFSNFSVDIDHLRRLAEREQVALPVDVMLFILHRFIPGIAALPQEEA